MTNPLPTKVSHVLQTSYPVVRRYIDLPHYRLLLFAGLTFDHKSDLVLVNTLTRKVIFRKRLGSRIVTKIQYCKDDDTVTVLTHVRSVLVFKIARGGMCQFDEFRHDKDVYDYDYVDGLRHVATCGDFPGIMIWDCNMKKQVQCLTNYDAYPFRCVRFQKEKQWLVAGFLKGIIVFCYKSKEQLFKFDDFFRSYVNQIDYCPFSEDRFFAADHVKTFYCFHIKNDGKLGQYERIGPFETGITSFTQVHHKGISIVSEERRTRFLNMKENFTTMECRNPVMKLGGYLHYDHERKKLLMACRIGNTSKIIIWKMH